MKRAMLGVMCLLTSMQLWASQTEYDLDDNGVCEGSVVQEVKKEFVEFIRGDQQRLVEVNVIPEELIILPLYCSGHWNRDSKETTYCEGCRGGNEIVKSKRVEIIRDIWVGCDELEHAVSMGYAEVCEEYLTGSNETRWIAREPIKRDAWGRTRTYALTKEGAHIHQTKQY
jgi:hypothetical protein